jgi:hypothetical protein
MTPHDDEFAVMENAMREAVAAKAANPKGRRVRSAPSPSNKRPDKVLKLPAASKVLKRPAASGLSSSSSPRLVESGGAVNGVIYYKGSTIYTSDYKGGYRVLMPGEKRVDKLFRWDRFPSKAATLTHVKTAIDEAVH